MQMLTGAAMIALAGPFFVNGGGKTSHGAAQVSATSGIWNGCWEGGA